MLKRVIINGDCDDLVAVCPSYLEEPIVEEATVDANEGTILFH